MAKLLLDMPSKVVCKNCGKAGYVYYMKDSEFIAKCINCNHYIRKGDYPMAVLDRATIIQGEKQ